MVSPQNGDTRGGPLPLSDATAKKQPNKNKFHIKNETKTLYWFETIKFEWFSGVYKQNCTNFESI